ncbi:MAG: aminopeptidase [Bacteroidetes bacterium]|nr:aminopeptidase [Bacteroidota bacterium]
MKYYITTLMVFILGAGLLAPNISYAQDEAKKTDEGYQFTIIKQLPATPVENQYKSSTCWSYATISFLESELLRTGHGEYDLSEMFIVRHTYPEKAEKYVRVHGKMEFGPGGASHDVTEEIKKYGIVPEEIYSGMTIGEKNPVHNEMDAVLKAYVDAIVQNPNNKLSPVWHDGFEAVVDAYLGRLPEKFDYKGKEYTPISFAGSLGLNLDDYIELASFSHHPFYEKFVLEVPDNWMGDEIYNIPLDDLEKVIDYSLENGYTVAWGADMSEKGFSWKNGVAIVPEARPDKMTIEEKEKWEKMTDSEKDASLYKFDKPGFEKTITQVIHQQAFDNYNMTDDHGMHITGIAKDQNGNLYYIVKNSWGTDAKYKGYMYASKPYVLMNTLDIMVNKDGIPKEIKTKLGIK